MPLVCSALLSPCHSIHSGWYCVLSCSDSHISYDSTVAALFPSYSWWVKTSRCGCMDFMDQVRANCLCILTSTKCFLRARSAWGGGLPGPPPLPLHESPSPFSQEKLIPVLTLNRYCRSELEICVFVIVSITLYDTYVSL